MPKLIFRAWATCGSSVWISRRWSSTHLQTESYVSGTSLSFLGFCSRYYCTKSQVELQATCHGDRDKFVLSRGRYGISLGYVLAGYPWDSVSLSQPKRPSLKEEKLSVVLDRHLSFRLSIASQYLWQGWSWRKLCPPPPLSQGLDDRPVSKGLYPPATGLLSLLSQHF